ncbi:MAG: ATPase domain-containing protein [Promethearchaeati archaeon SRVP18_Atabeyarchaeia-1]
MGKRVCRASLVAIFVVLLMGIIVTEVPNIGNVTDVGKPASENPLFSPAFNGVKFSSSGPPRGVTEYLSGNKDMTQQSIISGGTDTLGIDIPNGWSPIDLSAKIYQLSANQSFLRNSEFANGYRQDATHVLPSYWTNKSSDAPGIAYNLAEWDNGTEQAVYTASVTGHNHQTTEFAGWTQLVYINGTSPTNTILEFKIKRVGDIGNPDNRHLIAYAYVNGIQFMNLEYRYINASYDRVVINVSSAVPSLPALVDVTLMMGYSGHMNPSPSAYIYFDSVYLHTNCSVVPKAVDLKLNGASISGRRYGQGAASLHGVLATPFTFTSNTTGSVRFKCNSTIVIFEAKLSDLVTLIAIQGSNVSNNASKTSFFDASSWTLGSTLYTRDVLNVSIPHDWIYSGVIFPNGTKVAGESLGRIKKYDNVSSWIISLNVTSIGSYGPSPYVVQATSPNYLGAVSTFRKITGDWTPASFFVNGSRIMINATVQGGSSSHGSAYAVFYNASDYSVWKNMSSYAVNPGGTGILSFNFAWSNANVTASNLISLVLWSNSSEVGVNWIPITFDLTPPQVRIALPYSSLCAGGTADVTVSNLDAHPRNITLFIDGSQVGTWTSPSATYTWNTRLLPDGLVQLKVTGWDWVDHVNTTTFQVIVDNTPPTLTTNFPANYSYVHRTVTLTASFTDANPKNVTILLAGVPSFSSSGPATFYWNTSLHTDGPVELTAISWDQAGNFNRIKSLVTIDNTLPTLRVNFLNASLYTRGNITISISCTDINFKNVTLSLGGTPVGAWTSAKPNYKWNTTTWLDGGYPLTVNGWDLAGNNNMTSMIVYVDNTPPTAPTLIYPNNGEEFNVTTLTSPLQWQAASDFGSGVDHYILQLDTSPLFSSANLRTISVPGVNYSIPVASPLYDGNWSWRVSAVDRVGNPGGYSSPRSFQVVVRLAPPPGGLPITVILGLGVIPVVAVLSSIIFLRRRKAEPEEYDRKNLRVAYVFAGDGRAMFSHQFKEVKVEPQLVSGFLTAISEMMKEVVGGDRRPLKTIERSDAKIIIEFGTMVTGALVASKSSREYRRRLKAFLRRFEDDYADRITNWDGDQSIFQAAPETIEEAFSERAKTTTYPTIGGLEDLLFTGKLSGVAVSVAGKTGSGKTEFCLRYASSLLKRGKPVIVIAASLAPKDVREALKSDDVDPVQAEKAGSLVLYDAFSEISGVHTTEKLRFGSPGELNKINLSLSRNLSELKNATIIFDSLSAMADYSELELVVDFVRTVKVKILQGGHTALFIVDSYAHDKNQLNYIFSAMDGEIETATETTKKGEQEMLVSFKRLKGFKVKPGFHEFK